MGLFVTMLDAGVELITRSAALIPKTASLKMTLINRSSTNVDSGAGLMLMTRGPSCPRAAKASNRNNATTKRESRKRIGWVTRP